MKKQKLIALLCSGAMVMSMPAAAFAAAPTATPIAGQEAPSAEAADEFVTEATPEDFDVSDDLNSFKVTTDYSTNEAVEDLVKADTVDGIIMQELSGETEAVQNLLASTTIEDKAMKAEVEAAIKKATDEETGNGVQWYQVDFAKDGAAAAQTGAANNCPTSFVIKYNNSKFFGNLATIIYVDPADGKVHTTTATVGSDGTLTFNLPGIGEGFGIALTELAADQGATTPDQPIVTPDVPADSDNGVDKADVEKASEKGADNGKTSPQTGINA